MNAMNSARDMWAEAVETKIFAGRALKKEERQAELSENFDHCVLGARA
jgi:hypothetical protein